jgi:hypothetical protein
MGLKGGVWGNRGKNQRAAERLCRGTVPIEIRKEME